MKTHEPRAVPILPEPEPGTFRKLAGMQLFARIVDDLGISPKTSDKQQLLLNYFALAPDADKVWVIALFSGRRPRRSVSSGLMRKWCTQILSIEDWLFDECYHTVGDLSETLALLLPQTQAGKEALPDLSFYLEKLLSMAKADEKEKKDFIIAQWLQMNREERFVFNKLITGSFRMGVSQKTIVNVLAKMARLSPSVIAHRISGAWDPSLITFGELLSESLSGSDPSKPYPFFLAYSVDPFVESLGSPVLWQAEWKWDGIRGQLIKRDHELFVWSRGEELMTDKFPEYTVLRELLPDGVVLDGEIIPAIEGVPLPFAMLQTRIGRKNITRKQLEEAPVCFFAYDLLEYQGKDWRPKPLSERRKQLEELLLPLQHKVIQLSPIIPFNSWEELAQLRKQSRDRKSEGIMLKRKNSAYQAGRKRGDWWKWKIEPLVIDGILVYAQKGSGRRSNLYTDYTFAVRDGDQLVTFAKAYSGLTDKEFEEVNHFVRMHSTEKFGPVRTVKPELVFEIAFEGISASNRHKSGVALRFPRMSRWRKDKTVDMAGSLDELKEMLRLYGA